MILIDYNDKRPIYEQIAGRFQALIISGVMEADEKLPSVRTLAVELSINPNTIQRAYGELEKDGFIYTVKGKGNFVKRDEGLIHRQKERLLGELYEQARICLMQGVNIQELLDCLEKAAGEVQV